MQRLRALSLAASVSCITFFIYLFSLRNGFVMWDDNVYIVNNPSIRSFNLDFLQWAFTAFHASNWHPLTWISHALDYAIWGLNPLGHHLTNIILHAVNTFFVVVLVARLVGFITPQSAISNQPSAKTGPRFTTHVSQFTLIAAGVTGLLFGIHPIHVESVAWVSERKDLLCALFFLLSIMSYVKYATALSSHGAQGIGQEEAKGMGHRNTTQRAESKEQRAVPSMRYAPGPLLYALGFFALALMSKPMAVSLPVVLLLLDWYPFGRIRSVKTFLAALTKKSPLLHSALSHRC